MKNFKISLELKITKDTKDAFGLKGIKTASKISNDIGVYQVKDWTFANFFVVYSVNSSKDWTTRFSEFFHLWPLQQWISSLVGLILLYWITGYYYNKWLSDRGGWLSWERRIWLILLDFSVNLFLGIYYMNYRETVLGAMMLTCPIAISPLIFLMELICFYMYSRFVKKGEKKENKLTK